MFGRGLLRFFCPLSCRCIVIYLIFIKCIHMEKEKSGTWGGCEFLFGTVGHEGGKLLLGICFISGRGLRFYKSWSIKFFFVDPKAIQIVAFYCSFWFCIWFYISSRILVIHCVRKGPFSCFWFFLSSHFLSSIIKNFGGLNFFLSLLSIFLYIVEIGRKDAEGVG